jgi:RNA polymerase sigma-70 factor (ECF subfamily)
MSVTGIPAVNCLDPDGNWNSFIEFALPIIVGALRKCRVLDQDMDDLIQTSVMNAVVALRTIQKEDLFYPKAWLAAIARNAFRDEYRRQQDRPTTNCDAVDQLANQSADNGDEEPWYELIKEEERTRIREFVDRLPPAHRDVVLHWMDGKQYVEIATFLDIPLGTVRSRFHNACNKIRELMRVN